RCAGTWRLSIQHGHGRPRRRRPAHPSHVGKTVVSRHRVAIIGLGMALKPHIRSLEELSDRVEIAACYAPSAERRKAFAAAHGYPVAEDLARVLQARTIEAAVILPPPNTHLELVERCAAAGKHVLLEKPIDGTVARARRAVEAMERSDR